MYTPQYTMDSIEWGMGSYGFHYHIDGYHAESIVVRIARTPFFYKTGRAYRPDQVWRIEIWHGDSATNRNRDEVEDDIEAAANFVQVMNDARKFGAMLRDNLDRFESEYKKAVTRDHAA